MVNNGEPGNSDLPAGAVVRSAVLVVRPLRTHGEKAVIRENLGIRAGLRRAPGKTLVHDSLAQPYSRAVAEQRAGHVQGREIYGRTARPPGLATFF